MSETIKNDLDVTSILTREEAEAIFGPVPKNLKSETIDHGDPEVKPNE